MGLIRAIKESAKGTLGDQWKEFFYCDAMDKNVLVTKGVKRTNGNNKGNDNIISNGSGIAVADGQCMIIVEQGQIIEVCSEPGEFTFDSSSEPSIFAGNLGESVFATFKTMAKRFAHGGDTGKDQRVYYFNTKEILDNKFGTPSAILFKVEDKDLHYKLNVNLRCSGIYTYKITDPLLFYTNVCGNVEREYLRDEIDSTLKAEFVNALPVALANLAAQNNGLQPEEIAAHNFELVDTMMSVLTARWSELRGISVVNVAINNVNIDEKDAQRLAELQDEAQREARLSDPTLAAAALARAQADAMKAAASNAGGAMNGFMNLNMANQAGGLNAQTLFAMGQAQQAQQQAQAQPQAQPQAAGWTCSCGALNQGKFCANCGAKKPAGAPLYKCDKCGWMPEDPTNPPKFCPQCGDPFNDADIQ